LRSLVARDVVKVSGLSGRGLSQLALPPNALHPMQGGGALVRSSAYFVSANHSKLALPPNAFHLRPGGGALVLGSVLFRVGSAPQCPSPHAGRGGTRAHMRTLSGFSGPTWAVTPVFTALNDAAGGIKPRSWVSYHFLYVHLGRTRHRGPAYTPRKVRSSSHPASLHMDGMRHMTVLHMGNRQVQVGSGSGSTTVVLTHKLQQGCHDVNAAQILAAGAGQKSDVRTILLAREATYHRIPEAPILRPAKWASNRPGHHVTTGL
jgi:hypothetical protein